jgi:glycosyltransferase involved in cell wall biosynthesis
MLQSLYAALQDVQKVQLKLFGRPPNWSESQLQQLNEQGIYRGLVPRDLLRQELKSASALLVTISFDPKNRRWAETSFPSKLVEYCQYTKPVIIWGPEYCSAIRWARNYQSALVVTSPSAEELVNAIKELAIKPEKQKLLANKALVMAQGMFNPINIQKQFIDGLYQVVSNR